MTEHKISQYADDTKILLEGDKRSFTETSKTIEHFGTKSGLLLNAGKTNAIWLGSRCNSRVRFMQHMFMSWNPPTFNILGVWFSNDLSDCADFNVLDKMAGVKALYQTWLKRQICNPQIIEIIETDTPIHLWILLPNPPDDVIDKLQNIILKFEWIGKKDRISRRTAVQTVPMGGLGIPDS